MAVKTVATQTCDVCGDKVGDIQAIDAASVPSRGIRVQSVEGAGEVKTVVDLYAFEDTCSKCLGAVNTLLARLMKRNKSRAEKGVKGVKGKRAAKAAEKVAVVVAPVAEGEPKKKRGRPKKLVEAAPNTAPIRDSVPPSADAAEPEAHANGVAGAEATHPF